MKLYESLGPNPRTVRMFLAEKGVEIPRVKVDIVKAENRAAPYLGVNPTGQTPALELDDGRVITEITAICEYLEEVYPTPSLFGATPEQRAETRMWTRRIDLNILEPLLNGYRYGEGVSFFEGRMKLIPHPETWRKRASQLDEIWTATRFVADALRREFEIPVHEIMPGLELPAFVPLPRSSFGLDQDKFLFLFTFHMTSIMERKNPLGLIRAFKRAFPSDRSVGLVLKTSFGSEQPEQLAALHRAAQGSDITIIDAVYSQAEVLGLMQCCDAYVSLHRSEGYGLTMAEAMLLGKPVVATNYSGNLDFMSAETSLLVDYELVTLDRSHGPYEAGTRWAEPSLEHAAALMRRIAHDRDGARALGRRAQADLLDRMSYRRSGALMETRLAEIATRKRARESFRSRIA